MKSFERFICSDEAADKETETNMKQSYRWVAYFLVCVCLCECGLLGSLVLFAFSFAARGTYREFSWQKMKTFRDWVHGKQIEALAYSIERRWLNEGMSAFNIVYIYIPELSESNEVNTQIVVYFIHQRQCSLH